MHDEHEPARRRHPRTYEDEEAQKRYKVRAHKGETPFAVIKACFNMRRFYCGESKAYGRVAMGVDSIQPTQAYTDDARPHKPASPNSKVGGKDRETAFE